MQIVRVVDYSPAWPERYRRESAALAEVFGPELVAIHHIGSTSVQGLAAKPIIDMLAEVKAIGRVDVLDAGFMRLGYEPMGEFGTPGRRYFRKDSVVGGERQRTHQLHVFAHSDRENVVRHLAVPAYLRRHPEDAAAYAALKKALAMQYPMDIEGYCDGKDACVRALERRAVEEYRRGTAPHPAAF